MEPGYPVDLNESEQYPSLAPLDSILQQEEDALAELESLVMGQRPVLIGSEPGDLLDTLQRIEQVLGKIGQLEAARERLSTQSNTHTNGSSDIGQGMVAPATIPSISTHFLTIRHRILGAIARIAQQNDANRQLLASLARVTGATVERLLQLCESNAASVPPSAIQHKILRSSMPLDVKA